MECVLTPEEMKIVDATAINNYSIPSIILMENAAKSASDYIRKVIQSEEISNPEIGIFCGSGNNGGDGFAIARHLSNYYNVYVYWTGDTSKMSDETKYNFDALSLISENIIHIKEADDFGKISNTDIIIDSMIGVGGSENIKGITLDILKWLNEKNTLKFAIDIPTGLNSLTGYASEYCFKADHTITMYAKKIGLMINNGPKFSGKIFTADLGAPFKIVENNSNHFIYSGEDIGSIIKPRLSETSKFDYGRVVILAGSAKYPGAGALTANSSIKTGAGLVELFTEYLHPATLPEVINPVFKENEIGNFNDIIDKFIEHCNKANSIVIGPGLGEDIDWQKLTEFIYSLGMDTNLLIDADGLRAIDIDRKFNCNTIITPHCGELARMTGIDRNMIENNPENFAKEYANKLNCVVHLKSVPCYTTDGSKCYLTVNGNPGMATAGSGDVLSGIIAGLSAQGYDALTAASMGAYIHAGTAEIFVNKYSENNLTASEMVNLIKEFMVSNAK